jgi:hypothetical protein
MSGCEREDHRFAIQQVDQEAWQTATEVNLAADYLAGHRQVVESFIKDHKPFWVFGKYLRSWGREQLRRYVDEHRRQSLAFLVLMLTGECNADCPICFTDRRRKRGELTPGEREVVLRQAAALGARFVYVPGEGEPTIDRGFWQFLEHCRDAGLHAVVFTNALVLSSDATCQRYWRCDVKTAIARLSELPVSFYVKHWSGDPALVGAMMNIDPLRYNFTHYQGWSVNAGLSNLLRDFPRERLGLEIVVERRNADEVVSSLVPFAEAHGLKRIVEMLQHNGRTFGDASYDASEAQAAAVAPLLSPTSCQMATCKAVVTSRGRLSPRIAVLESQLPADAVDVRKGELFDLLHQTPYIAQRRYSLGCLCEEIPVEMAGAQERLKIGPKSVVPGALAGTVSLPVVEGG